MFYSSCSIFQCEASNQVLDNTGLSLTSAARSVIQRDGWLIGVDKGDWVVKGSVHSDVNLPFSDSML